MSGLTRPHPAPSTMQPTIHARYRLTRDEMFRSMAHYYRTRTRRAFIVAGHLLALDRRGG